MQPRNFMINAQLFHGLYFQAAFKTKVFREALGHAEDYHFTQFMHRGSIGHSEMRGFNRTAIFAHNFHP